MHKLKPMEAVDALYSKDDPVVSAALMASLSRSVFEGCDIQPAGRAKRVLARISHRVLRWTTRSGTSVDETGVEVKAYSNKLLERSKHPYAKSLLTSSSSEMASLVEGGDPMTGHYMMLAPEVRKNCGLWDRLFFDSVQSRDVQMRLIWETRATYDMAKSWLSRDEPVRMKAVAAGTGLSMMLVYDRLIRDGFNPTLISAKITDREPANIAKANNLLDTLAQAPRSNSACDWRLGISAATEDIFSPESSTEERCDIVTAIGILEYFQGGAYTTTEHKLALEHRLESLSAHDLVRRLTEMTSERASLIINTYKDHFSTRILELFGKRFDYRRREDLSALLASVNFKPTRLEGSGNIYDVKVYEKSPLAQG